MYSRSCIRRAHFFIHLHMYMLLHHCVSLWKCKKIQIPYWHRLFPSLWASSDNLSVCGLVSLAMRKTRFPRGRTSLRFLRGTKITVHGFLTKRRFRKTRNAIVMIFLRWQLTLFLQLELQLSPHWPLQEHPLLLFPLRFVLKQLLQLHPCDLT